MPSPVATLKAATLRVHYVMLVFWARVQMPAVSMPLKAVEDPPVPHRRDTRLVMRTIDEDEARRVSRLVQLCCIQTKLQGSGRFCFFI